MATTTTNYGFDVPTSSDLVKNGATQIALLGQDLDTFLFRPLARNGVINSSMQIWQRGTSFSVTGFNAYTADRWKFASGHNTGRTVTRQLTSDTTNLPFIQYCARVQRDSGNATATTETYSQSFENLNSTYFMGKTITFSFYARKGADFSAASSNLTFRVVTGTGTDQDVVVGFTGSTSVIFTTATLTTTWQRFTATATTSSTASQLGLFFAYASTGTAGAADYFEVTGVQLEVGSQVTPYTPNQPTYATELAACQRYYQVIASGANKAIANCMAYNANQAFGTIHLNSAMRTAPTISQVTGTDYYAAEGNAATDGFNSFTGVTYAETGRVGIFVTSGISLTQGYSYWFITNNASAFLAIQAEL
jgi:hypothetical protein